MCRTLPILVLITTAPGFVVAQLELQTDLLLEASEQIVSMVAGDFNGDGLLDVASANRSSSDVCVLLNSGGGGFAPPLATPVPNGFRIYFASTQFLEVADFDGDGDLDLVGLDEFGLSLTLLLGDGTGAFLLGGAVSLGALSNALLVDDFNGDGLADVVTAGTAVQVHLGNGDGTFQLAQSLAVPVSSSLVGSDFDSDGDLDIAAGNATGIAVLLGDGSGTFTAGPVTGVAGVCKPLASVDLDQDGSIDLLAGGEGVVFPLLGDGLGGFLPGPASAVFGCVSSIATLDLDQDGITDFVAGFNENCIGPNPGFQPVTVFYGDGIGGVGSFEEIVFDNVCEPRVVLTDDFDGDGLEDIVVGSEISDSGADVALLAADGQGGFEPASYPIEVAPGFGASGDFNGDALLDFVVGGNVSGHILVYTGDPQRGLRPKATLAAGADCCALGDIDSDGNLDIVTGGLDQVRVFLGDGTGNLVGLGATATGGQVLSVVAADFDGNGTADVVAGHPSGSLSIHFGTGGGSLAPPVTIQLATSSSVQSLVAKDLDQNGTQDIAAVSGPDIVVLAGDGLGTFAVPEFFPVGLLMLSLCAEDLDSDGVEDLVAGRVGTGVSVLFGDGAGSYVPPIDFAAGESSRAAAALDYDLDGAVDIVVLNGGPPGGTTSISILRGDGSGDFEGPSDFSFGDEGAADLVFLPGDADGDFDIDFVVGNVSSRHVHLVRTVALPGVPELRRGDVDGDGVFSGLVDALFLLNFQFGGGDTPPCLDAADADDDGTITGLVDGLYLLAFQFLGGPAPSFPGPFRCGVDPTGDALDCAVGCP